MYNFILGYALGLVLFVLCAPAKAGHDFDINIHLASKHINYSGLNEVNPGLGIEYKGWAGGFYENSNSKQSIYAGKVFKYNDHLGLKAGAVSGYGGISPFVGLYGRYSNIEIMLIPPSPKVPVTIGFGLHFGR